MTTEETVERLSVTLKGGKDFDAPWVVLKGGSTEDVQAELAKLDADPALLDLAARVATAFQGAYVRAKGGQGNAQAAPQQVDPAHRAGTPTWAAPPQQPAQQPASQPTSQGESKFCGQCGGAMERREGISKKTNKPYVGWFCTADRDHKPVFER